MARPRLKHPSAEAAADVAIYEQDFYAWTLGQSEALRAQRFASLDLKHLAEEIEDLGKEQFVKLRGSFRIVLLHMLKWDHQPERRSRSWAGSIATDRIDLADVLEDNPSLRRGQEEAVATGYRWARVRAGVEMKPAMDDLPEACPYSLDDILTRRFPWP